MDLIHRAEFVINTLHFVVTVESCLGFVQTVHTADESGELKTRKLEIWIKRLRQQSSEKSFPLSDSSGMLSDEEQAVQDLNKQCLSLSTTLSKQLDILPETTDQESTTSLKESSQVIKNTLQDTIAFPLLAGIDRFLHELLLKDSRLNLGRTQEIILHKSKLQKCFSILRPKKLQLTEVVSTWEEILAVLNQAVDFSAEQAILSDLFFSSLAHRQELISKEHQNTFQWIFDSRMGLISMRPANSFSKWLTNEQSIYWISGKPGCGKSTLMKYIVENPRTITGLKLWTGEDNRLFTASFYFWIAAKDPLQKSDTGLLRSILFQILKQCPELIPHAFPDQWQFRNKGSGSIARFVPGATVETFLDAFSLISERLPEIRAKFCLFIDGLDEFQGNMPDIIKLVNLLSKSSYIKTCISSRPWKEFESSFGGSNPWKLYIHELTKSDMRAYITDLLSANPDFCKLEETASDRSVALLVELMVIAAEGVFLWVYLVVHALLRDMTAATTISDLRAKVKGIPHDLDSYFETLLHDITPQSSRLFILTLQSIQTLPLLSYYFAEHIPFPSVSHPLRPLSKDDASTLLQSAENMLTTQCQGLLKIHKKVYAAADVEDQAWLFNYKVDFLHRTIADFLQSPSMTQFLIEQDTGFNVHLSICKASLMTLKSTPSARIQSTSLNQIPSVLHNLFSHCKLLGKCPDQYSLLDSTLDALKQHAKTVDENFLKNMLLGPGNYWATECSLSFVLLYHCVSYGLYEYVLKQRASTGFSEPVSAFLSATLSRDSRIRQGQLILDLDMIMRLLECGLDTNLAWGDRQLSFWQQLVNHAYSAFLKGNITQVEYDALRRAIAYGANQDVIVEVVGGKRSGNVTAGEVVTKILAGEHFLS